MAIGRRSAVRLVEFVRPTCESSPVERVPSARCCDTLIAQDCGHEAKSRKFQGHQREERSTMAAVGTRSSEPSLSDFAQPK